MFHGNSPLLNFYFGPVSPEKEELATAIVCPDRKLVKIVKFPATIVGLAPASFDRPQRDRSE